MKVRNAQSDPRKNPDSTRVHGLRLAIDSSSATFQELRAPCNRNEESLSLPPRLRTLKSPRIEADVRKRDHVNTNSLRKSDGQSVEGKATQGATRERNRARGNWSVSPLWEAKILLGVLKEQGLAGKGLVKAFEKWAPTIACSSRSEISRTYQKQTGRDMSDYILVQLADKVVRYSQLPPEADIVRQALLNSRGLAESESKMSGRIVRSGSQRENASDSETSSKPRLDVGTKGATAHGLARSSSEAATEQARALQTCAKNVAGEERTLVASKPRLLDDHDPNVLLTTNEVASLTGFRPKTIRRWVSRKLLNYIRVGNRLRFRLIAVELFLGQREVRR